MPTHEPRGLRRDNERARDAAAREEVAPGAGCGLALSNKVLSSSRWMSNDVRCGGRHGCVGGDNGMTGSGLAQEPMHVRLQPEDLLQAGFGRLPLPGASIRRTQHLAGVLVHVVCVAWRLCGREEGERVRRHGAGGREGVDGRVRGVRHCGDDAREETDGNGDVCVCWRATEAR